MKKQFTQIATFITIIMMLIWQPLNAQAPQKMSYQAVIRDASNTLVTNAPIGMRISILQGSSAGASVYTETQNANTNANGLVSLEIGTGTVTSGTFTAINWANGPYFIKTETDPIGGTNYTIIGANELLSVPYALHAKTAEGITGGIVETDPVFGTSAASSITTTDISNWNNKLFSETDPLFAASVASTITSTDVTNWNNKLSSEVDGSVTNELQTLSISNDTVYLSNGGYAKLPAGFNGDYNSLINKPTAVSSFSNDTGYLTTFTEVDGSVTNELQTLRISNDTIYLSNGGFAKLPAGNGWSLNGNAGTVDGTNFIGTTDNVPINFRMNNEPSGKIDFDSRNTSLGYHALYLNTTGVHNSAFGLNSSENNTDGSYNSTFGLYSNKNNTTGNFNTIIGAQAGENNVTGSRNVFLGYAAGYYETGSNKLYIANDYPNPPLIYGDFATEKIGLGTITPSFKLEVTEDVSFNGVRVGRGNNNIATNTALGFQSLMQNTSGSNNTALGRATLALNTTGGQNTAVGDISMGKNTTGGLNTAIGYAALEENTTGYSNTSAGYDALFYNTIGHENTAYGAWAMHFNTSGNYNTAFGKSVLYNNTTGNNNTALGEEAGASNSTGSGNVFLGYRAGFSETGSNKLYIANSSTTTPLVYGDFATSKIGIGIITPSKELTIKGDAQIQTKGTWAAGAKARLYLGEDDNIWIEHIHSLGLNLNTASGWKMTFMDGTDENMRIDGVGNVGIGTTSPTAKLQVENYGFSNKTIWGINSMLIQSQTPGSRTLLALAPNGTQNADLVIFHNSDYTTNYESLSLGYENTLNCFTIGTSKGGTGNVRSIVMDATSVGSNLWKQLVLATNGNVGIGTTAPTAKLEVNGTIKVTGGTSSQFLKADGSLDATTYLTAVVEVADEFSTSAAQTSFTLTQTPSTNSKVKMYINGIRISNTAYSVTGTTLTYVPANNGSYSLTASDRVQFDYSK